MGHVRVTLPGRGAQDAFARRQYAAKHFSQPTRAAYLGAVLARHAMRAVAPGSSEAAKARRGGARAAVRMLTGRVEPPFGSPPPTAVAALDVD